jgi:hypothetical protein
LAIKEFINRGRDLECQRVLLGLVNVNKVLMDGMFQCLFFPFHVVERVRRNHFGVRYFECSHY